MDLVQKLADIDWDKRIWGSADFTTRIILTMIWCTIAIVVAITVK